MSDLRLKDASRPTAKKGKPSDPLRETREQLEQADQLRQRGQLEQARAICEPLVVRYSDYFGALHTLGLIYADQDNYPMALGLLVRAAMHNPRSWMTLTALSGVYLGLGAREMAAHTLEQARQIEPNEVSVLMTLGGIYIEEREYELAQNAFGEALALEPKLKLAATGLATCCAHLGQYAEAAKILEGFIKRGIRSLDLLSGLNLLPQSIVSVDVLKELDKLVAGKAKGKDKDKVDFEVSVAFIRAAFLDHAGRYADAWEQLVPANRTLFNQEDAQRLSQNQQTSLTWLRDSPKKAKVIGGGGGGKTISLFILAPSRSGKTTLETLLGALDGVRHGYENPIVENAVQGAFQSAGLLTSRLFEALPPQFHPLARDIYLEELARRAGSARVFTNTHPAHIHNASRMAAAFPNMRFIFIKRILEDTVLRIYMRKYRRGNVYSYDLKSAHEHVIWYHQMIDLLTERLGDRARIIHYEEMVTDPAGALREAADLCGLPMTDGPLPPIGDDRGCAEPYRELMAAELKS